MQPLFKDLYRNSSRKSTPKRIRLEIQEPQSEQKSALIPLRADGFTLEWESGACVVKLRALGGMPPRRHTEAPLGRAPRGTGATIEPPRIVHVGNWRPPREGVEKWLTVPGRDQGAASFVQMLRENAERLGARVVGVDEEYTTMSDQRSVIRHA